MNNDVRISGLDGALKNIRVTHWGERRYTKDAKVPTSVAQNGNYQSPQSPTMRREIARFSGTAFSAERDETGDLVIYHHSSVGAPLQTNLVGDKAAHNYDQPTGSGSSLRPGRVTASRYQAMIEEMRRDGAWGK